MFHIYDKETNRPVKVCMTTDELEQMLAEKQVDFDRWEVQPCYTTYEVGDASFWMSTNTHLLGVDWFSEPCYHK